MMGLLRKFVDANIALSDFIDKALPARIREDGNKFFLREVLPKALAPGITMYDLGGGSRPFLCLEDKQRLGIRHIGLDISANELDAAPEGIYDEKIVADLCTYVGREDADAVICQATLEHVPDTPGAMRAIATILRPGGRAYLFLPSRNAVFARLNLLLPEDFKRRLLFALFPHKAQGHDGFKAYYDHCTPSRIEMLARENGLEVEERHLFWTSSYFKAFTPAFVVWRMWQFLAYLVLGRDAAETFAYVLRKQPDDERPPGNASANAR